VLAYLRGLLGNVGRKNGWLLTERPPEPVEQQLEVVDVWTGA
jgi:hypothetical protein